MHSVLETSVFTRRADALLTREERAELISALAGNPQAGDLVPGLGGIRKMRFAAGGQGNRGAFAKRFGFSVGAVREWEQGRRQPEAAARVLLLVIASRPEVVDEVLAA